MIPSYSSDTSFQPDLKRKSSEEALPDSASKRVSYQDNDYSHPDLSQEFGKIFKNLESRMVYEQGKGAHGYPKYYERKKIIFEKALSTFGENEMQCMRYRMTLEQVKSYAETCFSEALKEHEPEVTHIPHGLDYASPESEETIRFVQDPANKYLGGGCFGRGYALEEQQVQQLPELAADIARSMKTDKGNPNGESRDTWEDNLVRSSLHTHADDASHSNGYPTPIAYTGLRRVLETPPRSMYGSQGLNEVSDEVIAEYLENAALNPHQNVNLICASAPNLGRHANAETQFKKETIQDLFLTFLAMNRLASSCGQEKGAAKVEIDAIRLGCGDFKNNPALVYVLQTLAARQESISAIRFFSFDEENIQQGEKLLKALMEEVGKGQSLQSYVDWLANNGVKTLYGEPDSFMSEADTPSAMAEKYRAVQGKFGNTPETNQCVEKLKELLEADPKITKQELFDKFKAWIDGTEGHTIRGGKFTLKKAFWTAY